MREINLNGYIDDEVWYGDEITPDSLHEQLYGASNECSDDVHIRLNSYGGSCNAAVRMFDDIRAYPGSVSVTVSGTAASAATMLCMAADRLEMTPGSLFMIHDPSMMAFGNERDFTDSINLLRACKESILNMYERRIKITRFDAADMMTATTWMDANSAFERGFVDAITEDPVKALVNSAEERTAYAKKAEEGVQAWLDRMKKPGRPAAIAPQTEPAEPEPVVQPETVAAHEPVDEPDPDRVKVAYTDTRLEELKY